MASKVLFARCLHQCFKSIFYHVIKSAFLFIDTNSSYVPQLIKLAHSTDPFLLRIMKFR